MARRFACGRLGSGADSNLVVATLLSITFACGLFIAVAHVLNAGFIAPIYDVLANLTSFACAAAASMYLGHWLPASLSVVAFLCWLVLAQRTAAHVKRSA